MNTYTEMMIARAEHEQRNHSLTSNSEIPHGMSDDQPGWVARQAERLLNAMGSGLVAVGEHLQSSRNVEAEATFTGQEQEGAAS